jgi:hypothetical protein
MRSVYPYVAAQSACPTEKDMYSQQYVNTKKIAMACGALVGTYCSVRGYMSRWKLDGQAQKKDPKCHACIANAAAGVIDVDGDASTVTTYTSGPASAAAGVRGSGAQLSLRRLSLLHEGANW